MRRRVAAWPSPCTANAATRISGARDKSARYTRKARRAVTASFCVSGPARSNASRGAIAVAKSPRRGGGAGIGRGQTARPPPNPHRTLTPIFTAFSHPAPILNCCGNNSHPIRGGMRNDIEGVRWHQGPERSHRSGDVRDRSGERGGQGNGADSLCSRSYAY